MWRRFARNRGAVAGAIITLVMASLAVFAPVLSPHDPVNSNLTDALRPPCREYPLGTDTLGRDVLTRILYGGRISLTVGLVVQGVSVTLGTLIGLVSGFAGGRVDDVLNGLTNAVYAFPSLLFAIAVLAVLGPGLYNVFVALGLVGWATVARLVRGEVLSLKNREFVEAARAAGAAAGRVLFRHILPNCMGPVVVVGTLGVASAILSEATLSFLGLGAQPPTPSWGSMLSRGREYVWSAPWLTVFPGLAILITILGLNLLGDGLRDILDPRLRQ
jgi:ABC-type dipeptide/oligopeptide/nickel transport system permease subunit